MNAPETQTTGGWSRARLADLLTVIRGVSYKKEDASHESGPDRVPILRATNIQNGLVFEDFVHVPRRYVSDEQFLRRGDIVVAASSGSRNIVGKAAQLTTDWVGSFGTFCFGLRPKPGVHPGYLAWFLQTSEYRHQVSELSAGVNINNLRATHIEEIPIPVAPLPEQGRIVAEIEKQFTRLEAGVAALRRVQANLKRYRAAVLKAACEGRLVPTEAELAKSGNRKASFETGEALLARILAERRQNWRGRGKYKEPALPDIANLGSLPEGWTWSRIGYLFECIVPNRDKPKTFTGEIPWITLPDFSEMTKIRDASSRLGLSKEEVEEYHARVIPAGSVIMSCIGRFGLVAKIDRDSVINQQLHAFVIPHFLPAEYFVYALRAQKAYMESIATSTTIAYLNKDNCNSVPIPLPPFVEQTRIVAEVERRLSVVEEVEAVVSANLQRAIRLRESFLRKVFSGNL